MNKSLDEIGNLDGVDHPDRLGALDAGLTSAAIFLGAIFGILLMGQRR